MFRRIGKSKGFPQHTYDSIEPTKYLPTELRPENLWRSPVTQRLIQQDLSEFSNHSMRPKDVNLMTAIMKTRSAFKLPEPVKMLHLNDVFKEDLSIWRRSPGLPWRDQGYRTKDDIRNDPEAVRRVRKFWHLVKLGQDIHPPDCCAFVRSHITDVGNYKVRGVWGYPATLTFGEAVFAIPLIRAYKNLNKGPIAYGYETAIGGARRICSEFTGKYYGAVDFKKFDKTVPAWLINVAFYILIDNIDFVHYKDRGVADASKNYRMMKYLMDYFVNTPVRMANGDRFRKSSGIASGSYFTQLIGSVVNYILMTWCLETQGVAPIRLLVLGDDSVFCCDTKPDMQRIRDIMSSIDMEVNLEKSTISPVLAKVKFLGYMINDGAPSKDYEDWLASLMLPERPDSSWDDVASRALGLLYANSGIHERFDQICRAIIRFREFDLRLSANMERMLEHVGAGLISKDPPSQFEFRRRLLLI